MRPELFTIPVVNLSIKSYGVMLVLGFVCALALAQWRARKMGENPEHVSNFGALTLISGIIGARLFHVIHHWELYREDPRAIFAVWSGGLEFLGGFTLALLTMLIYFRVKKLPPLKFLDILAPAVMLGLAFGRMGCFLNGCCFGAPCELPWAVRFPAINQHTQSAPGCQKQDVSNYSFPYHYQLTPDPHRHPDDVLLELPADYYDGYIDTEGHWTPSLETLPAEEQAHYHRLPKPVADLTDAQREALRHGEHPMHRIHPAQLYSSLNAVAICLILCYVFRYRRWAGSIFALMLILYGPMRFFLESLRNDSPLEPNGLTISQNMGIACFATGVIMMIVVCRRKPVAIDNDQSSINNDEVGSTPQEKEEDIPQRH